MDNRISQGFQMKAKRNFRKLLSLFSLVGAWLILGEPAYAQFASLSGKVADQGGAVVPGVTVTLIGATGSQRIGITDESGVYQFLQVSPGVYTVKAELQGFKTVVHEKVELLVDTPTKLDLKLEVGQLTQTVTVEAGVSKLNTVDATLGNPFEGQRIRQLALESRNVANLLSIQPGVTRFGEVSGARSDQSNLTLDGIDVNDQQNGKAFESVLRVTPDSVQQFRVTTSTPNATQGRSSGGQVSMITRTGTNKWHGSLYEFHRNTVTTANDFFNNRVGVKRPKLLRNLFGGSVGGPIAKDRAFFFYNYEGRRDAREESVLRTVPLASMGRGELRYNSTDGTVKTLTTSQLNALYPEVRMNPAAIAVFADAAARYPANDTSAGDGLNYSGFRFNAPLRLKQNAHTATMNFNLTRDGRQSLLLRGNYQHDLEGRAPQFLDTPSPNIWRHPAGLLAQHTWTATPKLVNTFRYGITREAFSQQGDSSNNNISFRFIYSPRAFTRALSRTTPVHNFVDDVSWVHGDHTVQFGTNIRYIRNQRNSFSNAFDSAITNPSYYASSGGVILRPISDISGSNATIQNTVTALIGRYSQYSASFNFNRDGSVMPSGQGVLRDFGTEEYEFYVQDSWHVRNNLTFTLGLRYGLNTPVYETNGFQASPDVGLGEYFELRKAGAEQSVPYNKLISVDLSGPANGKPGFYEMDKNNFAPRASFAWQPNFESGILRGIFGGPGKSVFRGGFSMLYDRVGSALAVSFDLNNTLGFSSSQVLPPNIYNVTTRPGPLFTGFNQDIRSLQRIVIPNALKFPLSNPADDNRRIEESLDDTIRSPVQYTWNFSIGREFGNGLTLEASYIGRSARNLLAQRDIMALNNLVDPQSKMDWYTAGSQLFDVRLAGTPYTQISPIAYFENLYPDTAKLRAYIQDFYPNLPSGSLTATQMIYYTVSRDGFDTPNYTLTQDAIDSAGTRSNYFYQPQYGTLSSWSTIAYSNYHAGALSIRERFKSQLTMDLNYTFSKSLDNASGSEDSAFYDAGFILNPLRPDDNYAKSDFDTTHIINANVLWEIPIGRGRTHLAGIHPILNGLLGGWQLNSIFRWNTGEPISAPRDANFWATNWNLQSNGTRIRPLETAPTKSGAHPNIFADATYAYQSFRNAKPGETGERNTLRRQGFVAMDFGLGKTWNIYESHALQLRWEVFNVTNTQRLGTLIGGATGYGLAVDPHLKTPPAEFGRYSGIQGSPRVMQFALRYDF